MKYITLLFASIFCLTTAHCQVIVTVAGRNPPDGGFSGDGGPATLAKLAGPRSIAFDTSGNLFICDAVNARIRKVNTSGIISTIAGSGFSGYWGDGGPATAAGIQGNSAICTDYWGNVYIAESGNFRVRKISPDGIIRTIAGTGVYGYNGDGIPATDAQLMWPTDVKVDDTGNVYIVDAKSYRIRKINTLGTISTIVGTGISGYSLDGSMADTSSIGAGFSICLNNFGEILFVDSTRLRMINSAGILETVAGNGVIGFSGDGGPATNAAIGVSFLTVDTSDNIVFTDGGTHRIRKISSTGIISTIAGTGGSGYSPDGTTAVTAELTTLSGVAVGANGKIYFGETGANAIREITDSVTVSISNLSSEHFSFDIKPNPATGRFAVFVDAKVIGEAVFQICDLAGRIVSEQKILTNKNNEVSINIPTGTYIGVAYVGGKIMMRKFEYYQQ
ncbi:MAG: T9SS type A sorting domain-containing protein [Taibaiella sp.]|nr:T9SS type A sorting domain-containing protein [Taibaiella sp.]